MKNRQLGHLFFGIFILGLLLSGTLSKNLMPTDTSVRDKVCTVDEDCSPPQRVCREEHNQNRKICQHKKLFPMSSYDIIGLVVLILLLMISIIVSIAGGSITVPVLVYVIGTTTFEAVAISNSIILMTSGVKYIMGLTKKNPTENYRTIVDYNAAILMIPTMTLFSTFGSIIGSFFPSVLVLIMLTLVVLPSWYFGLKNLKKVKAQEKKKKEEQQKELHQNFSSNPSKDLEKTPNIERSLEYSDNLYLKDSTANGRNSPIQIRKETLESIPDENWPQQPPMYISIKATDTAYKVNRRPEVIRLKKDEKPKEPKKRPIPVEKELTAIKEIVEGEEQPKVELMPLSDEFTPVIAAQRKREGSNFLMTKFSLILICAITGVVFALFRGGKGADSVIGVERCSEWEWILLAGYSAFMILVAVTGGLVVAREVKHKKKINWIWGPSEIILTKVKIIGLSAYCCFVGLVGTMVGLGGGVPLNPFLTAFGYQPVTVSWTININTFTSKIAAVVMYVVGGNLLIDYTLFYGGLITVAMIISETTILKWVKKKGSQLFYPLFFLIILSISILMVLFVGVVTWITKESKGEPVWEFGSYCDKS